MQPLQESHNNPARSSRLRAIYPTESQLIRVMIADDHTMFREGLRKVLEADAELSIVGEAKDGVEVLEKDWIHITEVKPPTAIESRNNDGR